MDKHVADAPNHHVHAHDDSDHQLLADLLALDPDNPTGLALQQSLAHNPAQALPPALVIVIREFRDQASERTAKELLARPDVRAVLCPALLSVSGDVYDITKVSTPILLGLVVAGTITIPLVPVLLASIAILIARAGIASFCADYDKAAAEKNEG